MMRRRDENKPRVYDQRVPGQVGVVITEGPEVSEIRWEDGRTEYVTNKYIMPVNKVETPA